MAALLTFNDPELTCPGGVARAPRFWQATNDITGAACGAAAPAFCPTLEPLFALPPQPASCEPVGPPLASRVDVSGANAGDVNLGVPNVDPSTLNRLMAADQNSNCVASVNLDDMSVDCSMPTDLPTRFRDALHPAKLLAGRGSLRGGVRGRAVRAQGRLRWAAIRTAEGQLSVGGGGGLLPERFRTPSRRVG